MKERCSIALKERMQVKVRTGVRFFVRDECDNRDDGDNCHNVIVTIVKLVNIVIVGCPW